KEVPPEDPLGPWWLLASAPPTDAAAWAAEWRKLAERYAKDDRERAASAEKQFVPFADFRTGSLAGWQAGGHGLRDGPPRSGDFVLSPEGAALVRAVLPAGCFTHTLSDRLNGTLRSPLLPPHPTLSPEGGGEGRVRGKKHISFRCWGGAAARSGSSRTTA